MKRKIYTLLLSIAGCLLTSSCSDWFDVSPSTDVPAEELFETESGFQSALAGIYIGMTNQKAYGDNLSFGMLDQMAQLYDMIPSGASERSAIYQYENETDQGYNTKARLADTWTQAYKMIANANNLLKWLDKNGERVIASPETRSMLRGEALAIRAYLHFDILRGWGPMNYKGDPTAAATPCMPYRTVADNSKQPLRTAEQVLDLILDDLKSAKQLMSYEAKKTLTSNDGQNRRFRFNYHAINAVMARVYCYMGKAEEAITCAQDVIDHCGLELQSANSSDPILFNEVLCGLYLYEMEKNLSAFWSDGDKLTTQYFSKVSTFNTLFNATSGSTNDIRYRTVKRYATEQVQSLKYIKNENEVVPLIRLPEMYYILCEMKALSDSEAKLNEVRHKRGYPASEDEHFKTEADRIKALNREYRKEFYAEGQYYFFLKQHPTAPVEHFNEVTLGKAQYVFPLPDAEKEYGWTADSEENQE
ncbi:RagB/SusD family nutrient uptake outer membrane protein [uncultured Bacteroides sp.]|jgi:hypothetical protein|uniref:RagB/SusD family nutrient uptake outer membrane protein n=1 Tax=uncultured Bacteroides sp. TaxID=162156 RepID=UPI0025E1C712|nr:RagB/SusD family nutrient uptake outer membrane protein [uncultured Bacteroides sp.]